MNPMTLTNFQLAGAITKALEEMKNPKGSALVKNTRERAYFNLKAEAQRRINLGAW